MEATNIIYEIMTLLASATKGLKKSIELDGIDIFIAQSMTDIVRKVRDLAPEDMDIFLSQLQCELNEENYVRVCGELSGTMSEYLDLYESRKAAIDEGYSPFHLCEIAKDVECHDHDIFNKLEGDAPLALSKIVTRMMEPLKPVPESPNFSAYGNQLIQKNLEEKRVPGRPKKIRIQHATLLDAFINTQKYEQFNSYLHNLTFPINCQRGWNLYLSAKEHNMLKPDVTNAEKFGNLMASQYPELVSFSKGRSIYAGTKDEKMLIEFRDYVKQL